MTPRNMFQEHLIKTAIVSWLLKLCQIPFSLLIAEMTAQVVTNAADGAVDQVLQSGSFLLIVVIASKIFNTVTEIGYKKKLANAQHQAKLSLYRRFLANPLYRLYDAQNGEAMVKLNQDFKKASERYVTLVPEFWTSVITAVTYVCVLAWKNKYLALLFFAFSFLQIIPPVIVKKYLEINWERNLEVEEEESNFIIGGYRGFATIKLYNLKDRWLARLKEIHKREQKYGNICEASNTAEHMMNDLIGQFLKYGSYVIAGLFVLWKHTTLEIGVEAIVLAPGIFTAMNTIFAKIPDFAEASVSEKRLSYWFKEKENGNEFPVNRLLQLENVTISYEDKQIFNKVSLTIDAGRIGLFKGANGIGKSTLFRLITGLSKSDRGEINVGTKKTALLSHKNFPNTLCYLPQEDPLFGFTAGELFGMAAPLKEENIRSYAEKFSLTREQLDETKIRELSGGERKKVFLCLAFGMEPEILLMDEPTNSLDEESKKMLSACLKERNGGTLIITHEEVFDEMAEDVYYIENGGIRREKD